MKEELTQLLRRWSRKRSKPGAVQESNTDIHHEIFRQSRRLLDLCRFAVSNSKTQTFPCKDFLRELLKEATGLEEFLDSIGALRNNTWFAYREAVAAEKLFSKVYYNLLHIKSSVKQYKLLKIENDFEKDIAEVLDQFRLAITTIANNLLKQASLCGFEINEVKENFVPCINSTTARLETNRKVRHIKTSGKIITYLATKFLNFSENREIHDLIDQKKKSSYKQVIPKIINEEKLRSAETLFHNLQSHYDTYIFDSDIESQYTKLPFLRGHISIIYHLFESATDLVHYYERHMSESRRKTLRQLDFPLSHNAILEVIIGFLLANAGHYLIQAKQLCREMIQEYSEITSIIVPIPNYRGFHVRPSTLIAKIVAHYGSTVEMVLNRTNYDAALPIDLFRANEEINAYKRRYIADLIAQNNKWNTPIPSDTDALNQQLHMVLINLIKANEIIIYDNQLDFKNLVYDADETLGTLAIHAIKYFMSTAKLDVKSDLTIEFKGDARALHDIKLLAENGYGEDIHGNNIDLPNSLKYLRE